MAVQVDRYTKTRKSTYTSFELFSVKDKDIPMEVLELPNKTDKVTDFAWEPRVSLTVQLHAALHLHMHAALHLNMHAALHLNMHAATRHQPLRPVLLLKHVTMLPDMHATLLLDSHEGADSSAACTCIVTMILCPHGCPEAV